MAMTINTNIASVEAQRHLSVNSRRLENSIARLSSGLRIASASDDAVGLSLSEKMRAQIRSLRQAERNAGDAISLSGAADGALAEVGSMLVRMRELAIQSLNGSNGTEERKTMETEYRLLIDEIDRLAQATKFNGVELIAGGNDTVFQVGSENNSTNRITVSAVNALVSAAGLNILSTHVSNAVSAGAAVNRIDTAIDLVSGYRGKFGAALNRVNSTVAALASMIQNTMAAESRIRDVDVALETAEFTRAQVQQQAGVAVLAQANTLTQSALQLLRF